ncbi:hypothetical protein PEX1_074160 [Penicillium expansum]|uniref:Uncharacterized protein n=1 Tax=Penicillium expansum TaxID=27334 RepID=A0A0A2JTU0_PENEN|nr:hypothetical protein PEX2_092220 [Penicillium expansum]KGO58867.1 hypothetical protein PEX2_092220 [Penicillium expansum]KGO73602.1 hypothetical protein PEX1_074160 [Penicillium expansum]
MTYLEWFSEEWATVYNEGSPTFPYMTPARALQSVQKGIYKVPKYTAFELISMTPGWHIAQLKSIFASASMRRITIDGMSGTYPDLAPRNSSPITHIEVHGISRSGFKELITHCVNLKSFTYFYYGEIFSHFSMKSYIDAISSKKHSLETLCISQAPVNCPIIDSEAFNITFNGFSALKNLELPMHTFLQFVDVNYPLDHITPDRVSACFLMPLARNLPPSLERLSSQLGAIEKHMFPHLGNIRIPGDNIEHLFIKCVEQESPVHYPDLFVPTFYDDRLLDACREMGVVLRVKNDPINRG